MKSKNKKEGLLLTFSNTQRACCFHVQRRIILEFWGTKTEKSLGWCLCVTNGELLRAKFSRTSGIKLEHKMIGGLFCIEEQG